MWSAPLDEDLLTATGLALAAIAGLIERPQPVPRGELGRCLRLLAETASPERQVQKSILTAWAELLER